MKKNFWTKMVSLLLVLVCVASLAACGGDSNPEGRYGLQTMEMAGMTLDYEQLLAAYGDGTDLNIYMVLNEDGTFKLDMEAVTPGSSLDGTWKLSGSKLTLTTSDGDVEVTLKGGVITMASDGISMTFKKK